VADIVWAISALIKHPGAVGRVFNIGSTEEVSILELAERVIALTGSASSIEFIPYDEAYAPGFEDMRRRVPSIERVNCTIGYEPQHALEDTIKKVINYERSIKAGQQN
jgi:UDP-glucose 4-epimerase